MCVFFGILVNIIKAAGLLFVISTQGTFNCPNLTLAILEKRVKYVQS